MPLVRATLATALSTVQGLVGELRKSVREAGSMASLDHLSHSLDALDTYCARKVLEIEVLTTGPLSSSEAQALAAWVGAGFPAETISRGTAEAVSAELPGPPLDLRVQVRPLTLRAAQKAGTPRPPVLAVVAVRPFPVTDDERGTLERAFEDRPQVVVVGNPEEPHVKDLESKARSLAWTCLKFDPAAALPAPPAPADAAADPEGAPATPPPPPVQSQQARFSAPPFDQFPDLYRAHSAVVALDSLTSVFGMVVDQQQKELKVNKAVTQQKASKFQQKTPASPVADLLVDIKTRTQRLASEFERGASERLQELVGQPTGSLARELEGMVAGLNDLAQEQRAASIGTRVPVEFEDQVNRAIRERVGRHCSGDLVALNDLFRMIEKEAERTLAQGGAPPVAVQFKYLTDDRVRRMLDMYAVFQSIYKGEMPEKGFSEYFSSVRKYSMLIVMGASMFGLSSYLRLFREYVLPVTVVMVAWGSYNVYTSTKKQRIELMEKELDAARTAIRTDLRRILTEIQKQWGTFLSQYLNEQTSGAIAELDVSIKDYQTRKGGAGDPEKDRLQRQLQAFDAAEKRLIASGKARETILASIVQLRGDLRGLTTAPGGAARPGMPGGLAGARPGMPAAGARPAVGGAKPAVGASLADAKAAAMAAAKAKMDAIKAGKAAPAAGAAAGAPAKPSALEAYKAKMAGLKAGAAAPPAAAAPAATPPATPAPAAPPSAAAAPSAPSAEAAAPPAAAAAKPSALEAYKAKMAALKAGGVPSTAPAAAAPAAPAPAAPAPAASTPPAASAPPAEPAAAVPAAAAKPSALEAYKAKMAAMKAGGAGAAKPAGAPPAAAEPAGSAAASADAPAAAAAAKPSAVDAYKAKMAALKAAKAAPAAAPADAKPTESAPPPVADAPKPEPAPAPAATAPAPAAPPPAATAPPPPVNAAEAAPRPTPAVADLSTTASIPASALVAPPSATPHPTTEAPKDPTPAPGSSDPLQETVALDQPVVTSKPKAAE